MRRIVCCLLAGMAVFGLCAGCTAGAPEECPPPSEPGALVSAALSAQPEDSPSPSPVPEPAASAEPAPTPEPYWFGEPVEESEPVEEAWFADAAFLGDSRTEGLQLFSGLHAGSFFWYKGMTVFRADDTEYRKIQVDGESYSMMEALALGSYAKVYIMIGINELGYSAASYEKGLRTLVEKVKAIQPGAVIYLQTLPPVNETVAAEKKLGSYINNKNIRAFNQAVTKVAWTERVALLDVASVFYTDQGDLAADMAADGVHFYRAGYKLWYEYLKNHTLDPERYACGQALDELPTPSVPAESPSPQPGESPAVSQSPSPQPSESPAVSQSPSPQPSESPAVSQSPSPKPSESPSASQSPAPQPGESALPSQTPPESESPAAGEPQESPAGVPPSEEIQASPAQEGEAP